MFFRTHRWQRRLLSTSLTLIIAGAVGVVAAPYISDYRLMQHLASPDPQVRRSAVNKAVAMSPQRWRLMVKLEAALTSSDENLFVSAAEAMVRLNRFDFSTRPGEIVDRWQSHRMAEIMASDGSIVGQMERLKIVRYAIQTGRNNAYLKRILAGAAVDANPLLRRRAALLAGLLGDDEAMSRLLDDADPGVSASSALAAGACGRSALAGKLLAALTAQVASTQPAETQPTQPGQTGTEADFISNCAYSLAQLDRVSASPVILELLTRPGDARLRPRLLLAVGMIDDESGRDFVLNILSAARSDGQYPPATELLLAGRMTLSDDQVGLVVQDARDVLAMQRSGPLRYQQVLAAVEVARRRGADVLSEIVAMMRGVGDPQTVGPAWLGVCELGADLAGRRAGDDPLVVELKQLLLALARYYDARTTPHPAYLTMPSASAAACAALWRLGDERAYDAAVVISEAGGATAQDVLAWRISRDKRPMFETVEKMLPPMDAPPAQRLVGDGQRTVGAMLLALAARDEQQRAEAVKRITQRLEGVKTAGETDPDIVEAYNGSLLMLGQANRLEECAAAFRQYPGRRTLTPLLVAGRREGVDWLLLGPVLADEEVDYMLTSQGASEVLDATVAPLPPSVDAALDISTRLWQVRILRYAYAASRARLQIGIKP